MKYFRMILPALLFMVMSGCKPQVLWISVENNLTDTTAIVKFQYNKDFITGDSTVTYLNGFLPWPLKQFPHYDLMYYNFPNLSGRATIRKPIYTSKIEFRKQTATYAVRPGFIGYLRVEQKNFDEILGMIERITIKAGSDSVVCSTPEEVASMLRKSKYYDGINLCVDSTMISQQ